MTDSKGQCQKSADNLLIYTAGGAVELNTANFKFINNNPSEILKEEDFDKELGENAVYSDTLENVIADSGSVLIITEGEFNPALKKVADAVKNSGKPYSIIIADSRGCKKAFTDMYGEDYAAVAEINNQNYDEYDFFGITKVKSPVLIHNEYLKHDTIIAVSSIKHSPIYGYSGGAGIIMPGITAAKTNARSRMNALKTSPRPAGEFIKKYPVNDESIDAVMIARARNTFFSVNTVLNTEKEPIAIKCGDLFMAHTAACTEFGKFYNINFCGSENIIIDAGGEGTFQDCALMLENIFELADENTNIIFNFGKGTGDKDFIFALNLGSIEKLDELMEIDPKCSYIDAHILFRAKDKFNLYTSINIDAAFETKVFDYAELKDLNAENTSILNGQIIIL